METVKRLSGFRYREKITTNGKSILSPWYPRKSDAREWKRVQIVEKNRVEIHGISINDSITATELFAKYSLSRQDLAKRTLESYTSTFHCHVEPIIGDLKLKQIKIFHGEQIKQRLWELKISASRINDILVQLKIFFNFAVRQGNLSSNPFTNLQKVKEVKKEINFWSLEEAQLFLNSNSDSPYFLLFLIAINTGLRKSELCGLMWDCVDFHQKIILVKRTRDRHGLKETTKASESRKVPMSKLVFEELKRHYEHRKHPSYVFTKPDGQLISYEHIGDRVFAKALQRSNVRKIRFHDLRTTFSSHFCINNGNVFALCKILGHKSVNTTQSFYAQVNNEFLTNESERVNFSSNADQPESNLLMVEKFKTAPF